MINMNVYALSLLTLFSFVWSAPALAHSYPTGCSNKSQGSAYDYKVARSLRTTGGEPALHLQVSLDKPEVSRAQLEVVASCLDKSYQEDPRIQAYFFTDYKAAKRFVFSEESPTYTKDSRTLKAFYWLDRKKGESYLEYIPAGKSSWDDKIRVDLSIASVK